MIMQKNKASVVEFIKDERGLTIVENAGGGGVVRGGFVRGFTCFWQ